MGFYSLQNSNVFLVGVKFLGMKLLASQARFQLIQQKIVLVQDHVRGESSPYGDPSVGNWRTRRVPLGLEVGLT